MGWSTEGVAREFGFDLFSLSGDKVFGTSSRTKPGGQASSVRWSG